MLAYPRLDPSTAMHLLADYAQIPIVELARRSSAANSRAQWYPTARARVDEGRLRMLRDAVVEVAARSGYPDRLAERSPEHTRFDRTVGPVIYRTMAIVPADAADEGVWSFVSLVLLPDVSLWRFPNRSGRDDYERIVGRPRNVFRRLWWRCFAMGGEPDGPPTRLLEDEAVGIMERPGLAGDPRVATAIARAHLDRAEARPSLPRTEVMRQAMKRLRRLASFVSLSSLGDTELEATITEVFDFAIEALERQVRRERDRVRESGA